MSLVRRVIIDTSTLVSAALRVDSVPARVLQKVLAECELCASEATLLELAQVLCRPRFDRYLARDLRDVFVELVRTYSLVWEVVAQVRECRDPKDDLFLDLALACGADVIVSSDEDLLVLNTWRGVPVIRPSEFLEASP